MIHKNRINPDVFIRDVDMAIKVNDSVKAIEILLYKILEAIEEIQSYQQEQEKDIKLLRNKLREV